MPKRKAAPRERKPSRKATVAAHVEKALKVASGVWLAADDSVQALKAQLAVLEAQLAQARKDRHTASGQCAGLHNVLHPNSQNKHHPLAENSEDEE